MSSLTAVASLRHHRLVRRRFPDWLGIPLFTATALVIPLVDVELTFVYGIALALTFAGILLDQRYDAKVESAAPDLMTVAYNADAPQDFAVGRSWLDAVPRISMGLLLLGCTAGLISTLNGSDTREHLRDAFSYGFAAMLIAIPLVLLVLAVKVNARPVMNGLRGRPLLTLDRHGIRIVDKRLVLAWTDIDHVYCSPPRSFTPGLALRVPARAKGRDEGWVFVPESEMREGIAEVMAAAVSLHRAATGN